MGAFPTADTIRPHRRLYYHSSVSKLWAVVEVVVGLLVLEPIDDKLHGGKDWRVASHEEGTLEIPYSFALKVQAS